MSYVSFKRCEVQYLFRRRDWRRLLGYQEIIPWAKAQWWEHIGLVEGREEGVYGIWEMSIGGDYPRHLQHASVNASFPPSISWNESDRNFTRVMTYFRRYFTTKPSFSCTLRPHYGSAVTLLHSRTPAITIASMGPFLMGGAEGKKKLESHATSFQAFVQQWCVSWVRWGLWELNRFPVFIQMIM